MDWGFFCFIPYQIIHHFAIRKGEIRCTKKAEKKVHRIDPKLTDNQAVQKMNILTSVQVKFNFKTF